MNKIIFTIFLFTFFIVLNTSNALACSCAPQESDSIETQVKEAYTNSTAVFLGNDEDKPRIALRQNFKRKS